MTNVALRGPARAGSVFGRTALAVVLALSAPVVGVAAVLHGVAGAVGAGAGLGLVLVLFGVAALLHMRASALAPQVWVAVMVGGFVGRLVVYTLALAGLSRVEALHWPSLAIATLVGLVATLSVELRVLAKRPDLFWVQTDASKEAEEGADR